MLLSIFMRRSDGDPPPGGLFLAIPQAAGSGTNGHGPEIRPFGTSPRL